jgi:hypothetical protein
MMQRGMCMPRLNAAMGAVMCRYIGGALKADRPARNKTTAKWSEMCENDDGKGDSSLEGESPMTGT